MPDVLHPAWLPEKTFFNKPVPKNKFYEKLDVKPALKKVFVNQIEKIIWRNKLSPATLNVQPVPSRFVYT